MANSVYGNSNRIPRILRIQAICPTHYNNENNFNQTNKQNKKEGNGFQDILDVEKNRIK